MRRPRPPTCVRPLPRHAAAVSGNYGGDHCLCLVGYDDQAGCWVGKNSWGTDWRDAGFFQIALGECAIGSYMWGVEGAATAAAAT